MSGKLPATLGRKQSSPVLHKRTKAPREPQHVGDRAGTQTQVCLSAEANLHLDGAPSCDATECQASTLPYASTHCVDAHVHPPHLLNPPATPDHIRKPPVGPSGLRDEVPCSRIPALLPTPRAGALPAQPVLPLVAGWWKKMGPLGLSRPSVVHSPVLVVIGS